MAAFTINSGGVTNWDTLSGGSTIATLDTYTISNGSTLLINTDTYQCANHSTAFGSVDTVSFTGTGGRLLIDPTATKVVAYNTGTGNVPAIGATITQGSVSGTFLGVWANWQSEPVASATAMPASGFIKVKNITGGTFAIGALTGIGAVVTENQRQSWLEIRGADTATITVPRIGKFEVVEAWFELGTTNGTRGQVLSCPTTATVAGTFPGVWIETSAGSGVYEIYTGVGSMVNLATNPTDLRGKMVWHTTSGIRIGSDGVNNVGFLPPTGCKVRIPASIFTTCTRTATGSGIRVLPNATLATRQEFVTTSSGDIDINGALMQWYCNFVQPYRAKVYNSAINDTLVIQKSATALDLNNVLVSPTQAQLNFALNAVSNFAGGAIQSCSFNRFSLAASGAYVNTFNFNNNVTVQDTISRALINRANATTGTWTCTQNSSCIFSSCTNIGGRSLHAADQNTRYTSHNYIDNFSGTTGTVNPHYGIEGIGGCNGLFVNGVSFAGIANQQPYSGILSVVNSSNTTLRNVGDYTTPLSLGSANQSGIVFNTGGNCNGFRAQRIYVANTRTGAWSSLNSDNNILIETLKADYADTTVISSLNTITKGVSLLGTTTGQTAVYGTHWKDSFTSTTVGKIEVLCNEPTVASAAQCSITSGTPRFNSVGQIAMTAVGQQVTWEMPYFAKGHTALANLAPTLTGTNTGNLTYEFQYDKGSGYNGTWLVLNAANLTGAGAITPAIGVRLKVRATCTIANAGNLLTNIAIPTVTTSADQNQTYPLDTYTLTLTGLVGGSDIVILQSSTETVRVQVDSNTPTTYAYVYESSEPVDICVYKSGQIPFFIRNFMLPTFSSSLPVAQVADPSYLE